MDRINVSPHREIYRRFYWRRIQNWGTCRVWEASGVRITISVVNESGQLEGKILLGDFVDTTEYLQRLIAAWPKVR